MFKFLVFLKGKMKAVLFRPLVVLFFFFFQLIHAQIAKVAAYTHADSIKGTVTRERVWWDVMHYDLQVSFYPADSSITGNNTITYKVLETYQVQQLDLIRPMQIDSAVQDGKKC